jgi:putative hemolysin
MKNLIIFILFFGLRNAMASAGDWHETCKSANGIIVQGMPFIHVLCKIDRAYIGAVDLMYRTDPISFQAVNIYCSRNLGNPPPFMDSYSPHIPNPASDFCVSVGGKIILMTTFDTNEPLGLCHLPDGSEAEQWTLYRGNASTINVQMTEILGCKK